MFWATKWLPVFHILALCLGVQSLKPEMLPADPEIHINEGEALMLTCTNTEKMDFFFPNSTKYLITSQESLVAEDLGNKQRVVFRRPNAVHGDTGWYGCAVQGVEVNPQDDDVTSRNYNNPNVKWTYVYVKSNSSFFAQEIDGVQMFVTTEGTKSKTIPCRPTSPDYRVLIDGLEIKPRAKKYYDPRFGLILNDLEIKDSGFYTCSITVGNSSENNIFHLSVRRNMKQHELTINNDTLGHVTRGQTLNVNCTTQVYKNIPHRIYWITPQHGNRILSRVYINDNSDLDEFNTVTSNLIINDVRNEDEGEYTCAMQTMLGTKNVTTFIKVHES